MRKYLGWMCRFFVFWLEAFRRILFQTIKSSTDSGGTGGEAHPTQWDLTFTAHLLSCSKCKGFEVTCSKRVQWQWLFDDFRWLISVSMSVHWISSRFEFFHSKCGADRGSVVFQSSIWLRWCSDCWFSLFERHFYNFDFYL